MDTSALLNHLRNSLPDPSAIYLFGSHAQGTAGPDSDLDLAVLTDKPMDPVVLWKLASEVADQAGCSVDLVDLRSASTVMQYQIITTGQRLWARDSQAALYESFILSEKTALDTARAGLLQDIAKEGRVHGR
jgi:predicted nucleotidyltransferase